MDYLRIEPKHDSPLVIFNHEKGTLLMEGTMHPENIQKFMNPIMDWFNDYSDFLNPNQMNLTMEFFFKYLNSSSYKYLINILQKLIELQEKGAKIKVFWKYENEDEDMKERGLDLFEFTGLPLEYECIAVEEED